VAPSQEGAIRLLSCPLKWGLKSGFDIEKIYLVGA